MEKKTEPRQGMHKVVMDKIATALAKVVSTAVELQMGRRDSAYIVALRRLDSTYKERGIFP